MSFNYTSMADFNQNAQQQYSQTMNAFGQQLSRLQQSGTTLGNQYQTELQGIQNWGQGQQYGAQQVYNQNLANIQQANTSKGLGNTTVQGNQDYQAAGGYQQALLGINQGIMQNRLGVQQAIMPYQASLGQQEAGVYGAAANYMGQTGQISQQLAGQQTLQQQQIQANYGLAAQQAALAAQAQARQQGYAMQSQMIGQPPVTQTSPYGFQVGGTPTMGGYVGGNAGGYGANYAQPADYYGGGGGDGDYGYSGGDGS